MRSIIQTTDMLSRSLKSLETTCGQFSRGFAVMTKTIEKAKAPFEQIRQQADRLKDIGKGMMLKAGASMMIGLAPSVDAAAFEKAMAEVATLTDMGVKEFRDKYGKQIVELSVELGQDPALVVKGMYQAISAGVDPEEAIEFMRKTGQAAIAGVSDIFTSVDLATSIKNAFNVPMAEMGKVNDIIFQTVRKGKTTYAEIARSFSQVAAAASSAGISLEHVQAAVAQMTLAGVSTERAYTSLKYVIDALVAPSNSAKKAFNQLGIEINAEVVRQKDLIGVMDELMEAMSRFSEKEQAELIADIFGSQEAQIFVKDFGTNIEKYKSMLKDIENSTGVTEIAYKKMAETSAHQFEKMKQSFKAIRIAAGTTILPTLNVMLNAIKSILTPLANFAQRHKVLSGILLGGAVAISAVVAGLGILGVAVGMAIKGYTNLRIALSLFTTNKWRMLQAVKAVAGAIWMNIKAMALWTVNIARVSFAGMLSGLKAVATAMRAFSLSAIAGIRAISIAMLTTPVGWILTGIAALVGAGYLLWKNWAQVSRALSGAWNWLKENWKKVLSLFLWVNPITAPYMALNKLIKFVLGINLFEAGKKILQSLYQGMMSFIDKPVEAIKGLAQRIRAFLPFSPAKEGPFKDLHRVKIIETIAQGIKPAPAVAAMNTAMRAVRNTIAPITQPVFQKLHEAKSVVAPVTQVVRQVLRPVEVSSAAPSRGQGDRTATADRSVTINYSPTVNITGGATRVKEDLMAVLKQHQHELMRLIQDAQAKNMRLAY